MKFGRIFGKPDSSPIKAAQMIIESALSRKANPVAAAPRLMPYVKFYLGLSQPDARQQHQNSA
jgi:hypothetical protein